MIKSTSRSTIKRRKIEEDILNVISRAKKPISTAEISSQLKKSWHTIIRYCLDLENKDKIFKLEIGRISIWQVKK